MLGKGVDAGDSSLRRASIRRILEEIHRRSGSEETMVMRDVMKSRGREPGEAHGAMIHHPLHEGLPPQGAALASIELAVAVQVDGEGLDVVVEPELAHGPQHVLGGDGLALLALAAVVGLAGDEADVLGHAFLDGLLGVVGDLGVRGKDLAHDPDHVGYRHEAVLLADDAFRVVGSGRDGGSIGRGLVVGLRRG